VSYYTGYTNNLDRRVHEHEKNARDHNRKKYTGRFEDVVLLWNRTFKTKKEAMDEEKRIKKLGSASKKRLIQSQE